MAVPSTFVIIPTYNEADNIDDLLSQLLELPADVGVIVVDDNSPDGTGEMADRWAAKDPRRVHVLHRPGKLGLGTAYLAGFDLGLEDLKADRLLTMDADFSHHPRYIPDMLALSDRIHVVIGSRYVPGGGSKNCSWLRIILSKTANLVARWTLGLKAWDATAGFRVYRREVLEAIPLHDIKSEGYSFLVEMLFMCQRRGFRIGEIPIIFEDRRLGSTKISRSEVFAAQYTVLRLFWRRITGRAPQHPALPPAR